MGVLRIKKVYLALFILTLLCGCGKTYSVILVKCNDSNGVVNVYDQYGHFYTLKERVAIPVNKTMTQQPILYFPPSIGDVYLEFQTMGKYKGDSTSICNYIGALLLDGYWYECSSYTPYLSDLVLSSESGKVRLIVDSDYTVRIYAQDNEGFGVVPPYTNGEGRHIEYRR